MVIYLATLNQQDKQWFMQWRQKAIPT